MGLLLRTARLSLMALPASGRGWTPSSPKMRKVELSTGCQWAALPKDLLARSTVNDCFRRWDWDGTLARTHHALYVHCREAAGRTASATAAIIDSQSVKDAESGDLDRPARLRCRQEDQRQEASTPRAC